MAQLSRAADCLKKMAHPVRLRIVDLLMRGDYSVGELATACDLPEHQACAHLRLLQACGLLTSERQGREVHYRIASPQLPALLECVRANCAATPDTGATR
jgi:ArsR family transcriptional regulator, zinc-responsive transcriptional repressor